MNNNKLFVGGLAWATTEESLKAFFEQAGAVTEAKIIVDKQTGKSKGFGFVTMESDELADKAIQELNGKELDGRSINVSVARPPQPRTGGGSDRGGRSGGFRSDRR